MLLLAVTLLLALAVPAGLRWALQRQGPAWIGRAVSLESARFNPLTLTLTVEGLTVAGAAPADDPLLTLARGELRLSLASLWQRAPVLRGLALESPVLRLARTADGHYDIDDLLQRWAGPAPADDSGAARFALRNLQVQDGQLLFDDRPLQRRHVLRGLQLALPWVSTLHPADAQVELRPRLAFELDGARFDTDGQLTPFDARQADRLHLRVAGFDLAPWAPYVPAALPWRPVGGQLALDLQLQWSDTVGPLSGRVQVGGLRLQGPEAGPDLSLDQGTLDLDSLDWAARRLAVRSLDLQGLRVRVTRGADGQWGLPPSSAPERAPEPATPSAPWQLALAGLTLRDAQVDLEDFAVRPRAVWRLRAPQLSARDLRWPLVAGAPARLQGQWRLLGGEPAREVARLDLEAEVRPEGGSVSLALAEAELAPWQSYLASVPDLGVAGRVQARARLHWDGLPGETLPQVTVEELALEDVRLRQGLGRGAQPLAAWSRLSLTDGVIDPVARTLTLGQLDWRSPQLTVLRDGQGLAASRLWRPPATAGAAPGAASPGWQVLLRQAGVSGGQLLWRDEAVPGGEPVRVALEGIELKTGALRWPATVQAPLALEGRLRWRAPETRGRAGQLQWRGQLGLAPLSWRGQLQADQLPLHALAPYLGDEASVRLDRAVASGRWQGQAGWTAAGPRLALQGETRLTDWRLSSRLGHDEGDTDDLLLSWQVLAFKGLDLRLQPGQPAHVQVGQIELGDLFARLVVTEQGRLNLNDLAARRAGRPAGPEEAAAPAPRPDDARPAPAPEIVIGGVQLRGGHIDFEDNFIRPNYRTDLTDLHGQLGAFRSGSGQMAALQLQGRAAGTATLSIQGSFNPVAQPLALDLQARASDLELAPLSPYAGKYAGYAIERGKLTMDVAYRIDPDGRLQARNQLILNQLTFGERIDSPDATTLPVRLAVALLTDRDGVIDLNLPISGSINDPQFSLGGLVLKVVVNLLAKAVTAPFALLAGGDGPDLSQIGFEPGTARPLDAAGPDLDRVAQALRSRPGLRMTVTGVADAAQEREALQGAWLESRLHQEQRRQALRAGEDPDAVPPAPAPTEREALLRRVYADTPLPDRPRNVLGLLKDLPAADMEMRLRAAAPVDEDAVRDLALRRGIAVRDALLARGLPSERLFLAAPRLRDGAADGEPWSPSAELSLETP